MVAPRAALVLVLALSVVLAASSTSPPGVDAPTFPRLRAGVSMHLGLPGMGGPQPPLLVLGVQGRGGVVLSPHWAVLATLTGELVVLGAGLFSGRVGPVALGGVAAEFTPLPALSVSVGPVAGCGSRPYASLCTSFMPGGEARVALNLGVLKPEQPRKAFTLSFEFLGLADLDQGVVSWLLLFGVGFDRS